MKKFIVTGALGFLGRAFVNWALCQKNSVVVIVRDGDLAREIWGKEVHIIERDLSDIGSISKEEIGNESDDKIFVHFAWEGTSGNKRSLEMIQLSNVRMCCEAIRRAKEFGCKRFVNAGSIMEFEALKTIVVDGERPTKNMIYSIAKMTADFMLKTIAADIEIEYINVIISNIYGPGEKSKRFLNNVMRFLLKNIDINLTEGTQLYDFIYIDDAVRAIMAAALYGKAFESYYIGNTKQRPLKEYVIEAKEIVNSNSELKFGVVPFVGQALDYTEFDCTKIEALGVSPQISFREGVLRTIKWISENE